MSSSDQCRPATIQLGGHTFAYVNRDEASALYSELWKKGVYQDGGIAFAPGATIVDVGANIGLFALWANERCGGGAHIHCFEPVPKIFDVLKCNLAGRGAHLMAHPFGLSDREEEDTVRFHPTNSLWSTRHAAMDENRLREMKELVPRMMSAIQRKGAQAASNSSELTPRFSAALTPLEGAIRARLANHEESMRARLAGYEEFVPVRCRFRKLADFLREHQISRVDLLKVDTEGDEVRVLKGLDENQWGMIRQVVMEVDGIGHDAAAEAVQFLRARGYNVAEKEQRFFDAEFGAFGFQTHRPMMIFARRSSFKSAAPI